MKKRTKILATVGPASASPATLRALIDAGTNAFRLNFSHGSHEQRDAYRAAIRQVESHGERPVALVADLCGPKIRVGVIPDGPVMLEEGAMIVIQRDPIEGTAERISTTLPEMVDAVQPGEPILLADGRLRLEVVEVRAPDEFECRVRVGGPLSSGKGINLPATHLAIPALTEKDRADVDWIAERDFDYVALSFVRSPDDIRELRALLEERGCKADIIAKIEKPQALNHINEIIEVVDAVMVARGDLGVEMDFPKVPLAQKMIAHKAQVAGKPCIIATEMLESMIEQPRPTRAEVSDVSNAVLDMADVVMLSAESAVGKYPVAAVTAMRQTLAAAESFLYAKPKLQPTLDVEPKLAAALASSIHRLMETQPISAVIIFTDMGVVPRILAKARLRCPVMALSHNWPALRRTCLYYGVIGRYIKEEDDDGTAVGLFDFSIRKAREVGLVKSGDLVAVVGAYPIGHAKQTNGLAVLEVD